MESSESEVNKAIIAEILKAYGQGDLRPLLDAIDDSVRSEVHAPQALFRFAGSRRGREGVLELVGSLFSEYSIQRYDVKELVAEGNTVWALAEPTYLRKGQVLKFRSATRWVFRNRRIVEIQAFFDSAGVLAQENRLSMPREAGS
ncbi:MAG: nuclear transport factor 2 family protein [Alphaproteobacteria bacterium]